MREYFFTSYPSLYDKFYFKKYFTPLHSGKREKNKAVIKHAQYFIAFAAPFYCQYFLFVCSSNNNNDGQKKETSKYTFLFLSVSISHSLYCVCYRCGMLAKTITHTTRCVVIQCAIFIWRLFDCF